MGARLANICRRRLIGLLDKCFKWVTDEKSYSELELENYRLRLQVERLTKVSDYWRQWG